MAIRLSGLTSGLDTDAIVQELVSAYSLQTQKYEKASTKLTWKQDIWKNLNTKIYGLYTNVSNLRYSSAYNLRKTTVSDNSKVSVTATSEAITGTQKLKINKTAQATYITGNELSSKITKESKMSDLGYHRINTDIVLRNAEGEESKIKITKNTTVSEVLDQIKKAGYNASFDENNKRFFVSAKESGKAGDFDLVAYNENAQKALQVLGLDVKRVNIDETTGIKTLTSAAGEYADAYNKLYNGALSNINDMSYAGKDYPAAAQVLEGYNVEKVDGKYVITKTADINYYINRNNVDVYGSSDGTNATPLITLNENAKISVLENSFKDDAGNEWQKIAYDNGDKKEIGYIKIDDITNPTDTSPIYKEDIALLDPQQTIEIITSETDENTNVTTNRKQLKVVGGAKLPDLYALATIEQTDPDTGEVLKDANDNILTEEVYRPLTDSTNANKYLDIIVTERDEKGNATKYGLAMIDIDQYIDNQVAAYNKLNNNGNYRDESTQSEWGLVQWQAALNIKDTEIAEQERRYTKAEELYTAKTAHNKILNAITNAGISIDEEKLLALEKDLYDKQLLSGSTINEEKWADYSITGVNKDALKEVLNKQIENLRITADYHSDRADEAEKYEAAKDTTNTAIENAADELGLTLAQTATLKDAISNNTNNIINTTTGELDVAALNGLLGTNFDATNEDDKTKLNAAKAALQAEIYDIKTVINYNEDIASNVENVYQQTNGKSYFCTVTTGAIRDTIDGANSSLQKLYEEREVLNAGAEEIQKKMEENPCADLIADSKVKEDDDDSRTNAERLEILKKDALRKVKQAMVVAEDPTATKGTATKVDGQDAEIELNGVKYTGSSNSFSIGGLLINAHGVTKGDEEIEISTSIDSQGIYDKIKDFLTEYNTVINEMCRLYNAEYNKDYEPLTDEEKEAMSDEQIEKWETKIKDSLLRRDTTLNGIMSAMVNSMAQTFEIDGQKLSLSTFGIGTLGFLNAAENEHYAYHINGDEDDENTSGKDDELMKAIEENPDQIMEFMKQLTSSLYTAVDNKMKSTELSSAYKVYNDKEMDKELSNYASIIKKWEDKVKDKEDFYYKKFAQMETALTKLQNQTSSISGLFGQ